MATTSAITSSAPGLEPGPSSTQLLFARAVIYTFDLWPALRLAITEQWGGTESKAKADFLISYLCDEYSQEKVMSSMSSIKSSSSSSSKNKDQSIDLIAPATPDVDDLAEVLEGYFADEFESRLEDNSTDWIAGRLVQLHKVIYGIFPPTMESLTAATTEIDKLEQAAVALRGRKVTAQRTLDSDDSNSEEESDGEDKGKDGVSEADAMDIDTEAPHSTQFSKQEPIVDEDGFTTVVKGKRR